MPERPLNVEELSFEILRALAHERPVRRDSIATSMRAAAFAILTCAAASSCGRSDVGTGASPNEATQQPAQNAKPQPYDCAKGENLGDDVGICCSVDPGHEDSIPQPTFDDAGQPETHFVVDPHLNCTDLYCVSYRASRAYCTKLCDTPSDCPDGSACEATIPGRHESGLCIVPSR